MGKEKEQNHKQSSRKHYTENKRLGNTTPLEINSCSPERQAVPTPLVSWRK